MIDYGYARNDGLFSLTVNDEVLDTVQGYIAKQIEIRASSFPEVMHTRTKAGMEELKALVNDWLKIEEMREEKEQINTATKATNGDEPALEITTESVTDLPF